MNFNGVWPDIDLFCTLLENGINVVTTSDWITGHHRDRNHPHPSGRKPTELIEAACQRGGSTFYGTGMNPGLAQILSVVATAGMGRVDHVTVLETVDVSCHHSVDTWKNVGYGRPVDDPESPRPARDRLHGLRRLDLHDGGLPRPADRRRSSSSASSAPAPRTSTSAGGRFRRARSEASLAKFKGMSDGEPKIEVHLEWQMTPKTEPRWNVQGCYITTIEGDPMIINRHMILPATGTPHSLMDAEYFASLGMTITGMPALNAMRSVCEASPGMHDQCGSPAAGLRRPVPRRCAGSRTGSSSRRGRADERSLSVSRLAQRLVLRSAPPRTSPAGT